jgi:hypothetical protein
MFGVPYPIFTAAVAAIIAVAIIIPLGYLYIRRKKTR